MMMMISDDSYSHEDGSSHGNGIEGVEHCGEEVDMKARFKTKSPQLKAFSMNISSGRQIEAKPSKWDICHWHRGNQSGDIAGTLRSATQNSKTKKWFGNKIEAQSTSLISLS